MNSSAGPGLWAPIATLGPATSLWYGLLESSSSQSSIILISTGVALVTAVLWLLSKSLPQQSYFKDEKGQKIKLLGQNARLAKFINA